MTFRATLPLRFGDCDPAGIAYYPRLFALCDAGIEDWTEAVLGVSRRVLHLELGLALPTVALQADFVAVSRLGDSLDIAIDVASVGRSSVALAAEVTSAGERRFGVRYTQVLMDMTEAAARPWPDPWRAALEQEMIR